MTCKFVGCQGHFWWDITSFFLGVVSFIDVSTATLSFQLWQRNPNARYHLALSIISICHLCDFLLRTFTFSEGHEEKTADGRLILTMQSMLICDASIVFATIGGVGLQAINISRLRAAGKKYMPRATRILTFLSIVSMALCLANNIYYVYAYVDAYITRDYHLVDIGDFFFSSWSIFDGLVNGAISGTFVLVLQKIGAGHTSRSSGITKRFQLLLVQVAINLTLESLFIIASNILIQTEPTFDPYWCSVYFSEAARMLLFADFLHKLHWLLTTKPAPASVKTSKQGSGAVGINGANYSPDVQLLTERWRGGTETYEVISATATMIQAHASAHPSAPRSLATVSAMSEQSLASGTSSATGASASSAIRLLPPRLPSILYQRHCPCPFRLTAMWKGHCQPAVLSRKKVSGVVIPAIRAIKEIE
ncbi:hypothetical protein BCR44DRAFT_154004, partial [Catenaria anguillulae PL171]